MSTINPRSSKRRRRKPQYGYIPTHHADEEARLLQQALANSRLDRNRPSDLFESIPSGPVFYPTMEEFSGNPLHYISKIRPIAEKYGICKIVPPEGWNPPFCVDLNQKKKFQTKEQMLHRLQEGISFGDGVEYAPAEYLATAQRRAFECRDRDYPESSGKEASDQGDGSEEKNRSRRMTPENLERDYWNIVETHEKSFVVEYGNDVDSTQFGSGFPRSERGRSVSGTIDVDKAMLPEPEFGSDDYYKETWWNLNNIPCCPDSILRHVKVGINGINVPWMYYGSVFSTFCWHNEDNYLYSINYHHWGAPKQWYGIPGNRKDADGLERVFRSYLSLRMREVPDLLHHITTMFSPRLLQQGGVPVYKVLQNAGEFVVTFPRAFHGGFSMGPNIGEAVNFATHDWIAHGADANEKYRSCARPAVFSHDRLTFTMANHLSEQKSVGTCKLLAAELQRVVDEELRLRTKLLQSGVRDVSGEINLPPNRLDQLDEESADYDDKRLCHACKHICFFSAVACECSHSKVSCLRHSHYMCRCPTDRKYMMIWSSQAEMTTTFQRVNMFCEELKTKEGGEPEVTTGTVQQDALGPAPGSERDRQLHPLDREIDLSPAPPGSRRTATSASSTDPVGTGPTVLPSNLGVTPSTTSAKPAVDNVICDEKSPDDAMKPADGEATAPNSVSATANSSGSSQQASNPTTTASGATRTSGVEQVEVTDSDDDDVVQAVGQSRESGMKRHRTDDGPPSQ